MGLLHSSCDRLLLVTSVTSSLFVAQGLLSRCSVPEGSSLDLAGKSSPVLVCGGGGAPSFIAGGSFFVMAKDFSRVVVEELVFLLSCDRRPGVPLEL